MLFTKNKFSTRASPSIRGRGTAIIRNREQKAYKGKNDDRIVLYAWPTCRKMINNKKEV